MRLFHHEQIFRGKEALQKFSAFPLLICGVGAIGSNLAENLVRQGFRRLAVVDKDRIEEHNINTQVWMRKDIGALKADTLKYRLFLATGAEIASFPKELDSKKKARKILSSHRLVVDAFDNTASRQLLKDFCSEGKVDCLHIGFNRGYGEVIWNEDYKVPSEAGEDDCDYPLARNLVMLLTGVASEAIVRFALKGEKKGYTITLGDFKVSEAN